MSHENAEMDRLTNLLLSASQKKAPVASVPAVVEAVEPLSNASATSLLKGLLKCGNSESTELGKESATLASKAPELTASSKQEAAMLLKNILSGSIKTNSDAEVTTPQYQASGVSKQASIDSLKQILSLPVVSNGTSSSSKVDSTETIASREEVSSQAKPRKKLGKRRVIASSVPVAQNGSVSYKDAVQNHPTGAVSKTPPGSAPSSSLRESSKFAASKAVASPDPNLIPLPNFDESLAGFAFFDLNVSGPDSPVLADHESVEIRKDAKSQRKSRNKTETR